MGLTLQQRISPEEELDTPISDMKPERLSPDPSVPDFPAIGNQLLEDI